MPGIRGRNMTETQSFTVQPEQGLENPYPGIVRWVFPKPEYPGRLGRLLPIINAIANWLFWLDLLPLIADALDVLNPARFVGYHILDTLTCFFLIVALGLHLYLKHKHPDVKDKLPTWEIVVIIISSFPWPFLIWITTRGFLLPGPAVLVRLSRLLRVLKGTRLLARLAELGDNLVLVGSVTVGMWLLVIGFMPTNRQALSVMGEVSAGIVLFALVYDIRQRVTRPLWLDLWKKTTTEDIEKLRRNLEGMVGILNGYAANIRWDTVEEFRNLVGYLNDFRQRKGENIEIDQVERVAQALSRLRKLVERTRSPSSTSSQESRRDHLVRFVKSLISRKDVLPLEKQMSGLYKSSRKIIRADLLAKILDLVLHSLLFGLLFFVVLPELLNWLMLFPPYLLDINKTQINLNNTAVWLTTTIKDPKIWLCMGVIGILIFYLVLRHAIRLFTERTETALDDLAGAFVPLPVAAMLLLDLVRAKFPDLLNSLTIGRSGSTAGIDLLSLLIWTWVAIGLFNGVVVFALERHAEGTESPYDDIVARLIQRFGIAVIVGIALVVSLPRIQWSSEGMLATLLAAVVGTALLYIGRDFAENFFAGIYMVATRPFQEHDRIKLSNGDICDVRELGLTSTRLYKIAENTEIIIPNTVIAREGVTNLSQPDMMLKLQTVVYIKDSHIEDSLEDIEGVLLAILWKEYEVGKLQIDEALNLAEEIRSGHPALEKQSEEVVELLKCANELESALAPKEQSSPEVNGSKAKKLVELSRKIDDSKARTLAMLDQGLEMARPAIQRLALVLSRQPSLTPGFEIKDGVGYITFTILFFIRHLERKGEILGELHRQIWVEFKRRGITTFFSPE